MLNYFKARRIVDVPAPAAPVFQIGDAVRIHLDENPDACPFATPAVVVAPFGDTYVLDIEGEPEPIVWHGFISAA
ncbi:hypothetical protein ACOZDE_18880 [Streptomyces griseoincarnatus]